MIFIVIIVIQNKNPGGGFKYFLFSPLLGEMIQFDKHIFQMGWFNHQPENDPPNKAVRCHGLEAAGFFLRSEALMFPGSLKIFQRSTEANYRFLLVANSSSDSAILVDFCLP